MWEGLMTSSGDDQPPRSGSISKHFIQCDPDFREHLAVLGPEQEVGPAGSCC